MIGFNVFILGNSIGQENVKKKQCGNIYLNTKCDLKYHRNKSMIGFNVFIV